jgi:hypothetical protein
MKKSLKTRLTLNRETLRTLNGEEMTAAPGGFLTQTCIALTCTCITYNTCPTHCGQTYCYGV